MTKNIKLKNKILKEYNQLLLNEIDCLNNQIRLSVECVNNTQITQLVKVII